MNKEGPLAIQPEALLGVFSFVVIAGEYFIVEYGQPHDYISFSEGPIRLMNIMFHPRFIDPMLVNARILREVYNHYLIYFSEKQLGGRLL